VPVSVALKVGVLPDTGFEFASNNVIVIVEVAAPSATTDPVPVIVEVATAGLPATKVTFPPVSTIGVAIDKVFTSALVELNVHVETPEAFVLEHAP
jgi:hypothetical protein